MRMVGGTLGWMREFFGVERSGTQKISCSILQGNRKTEKAPCFRSSGTRVACLATQERCRRAARKRGVRSAPVFGFPPLCGVARGLPLAGGDGGNAPRHPASGMEARKGGDAAGGSVHDSPAAFGGTPAPLTRKKARPLRPDLARYCCWKKSGGIFLPSIRRAMASRMRGCSLSR